MIYLKNLKLFKVYVSSEVVRSNNTDLFLILLINSNHFLSVNDFLFLLCSQEEDSFLEKVMQSIGGSVFPCA